MSLRCRELALLLALAACEREQRAFRVDPPAHRPDYERNAWAMSEGKRLYAAFNCNGCHAQGGGDKGPPLIDEEWLYGHEPGDVYASIVDGRPNGMPAFRGRIAEHQLWQLTAYVRSMSGLVRTDAAPARADQMRAKPPEHSIDTGPPRRAGTPP